jgi:hypothetical protein
LNCATFSKHLLAIFMSWFFPAFWWWDSNIYLVFSTFALRPTSLLVDSIRFWRWCITHWITGVLDFIHRPDSNNYKKKEIKPDVSETDPVSETSCLFSFFL